MSRQERDAAYYTANRDTYIKSARVRTLEYRARNRAYSDKIKTETPCADCGRHWHPHQMDFDHVRSEKDIEVSRMVKLGFGMERLLAEIAKCDLVCANCHRMRTFTRSSEST